MMEFVSWDDEIPNIWKNKKCSTPPTRKSIYTEGDMGSISQMPSLDLLRLSTNMMP